jgi:NAD(P)-dependent dehydrogenase (short-subunit alcohol dehydrogenase family)
MDLTGRIAAITHTTTPAGRLICTALARAGATVCLGGDQAQSVAQVVAELRECGHTAEGRFVDPSRVDAAGDLVAHAVATFGRLDILVNTSVVGAAAPAEALALDTFVHGLNVNLDAMFFGCQAAARQMFAQSPKGGVIINVTSVAGVVALPGYAAFCAAMAGVTAATKTLAVEWGAAGVRVVGLGAGISPEMAQVLPVRPLLPDGVRLSHRRVPALSLASIDGLGDAAVYLASVAARHVSGMTLYVDGGWLSDGYWL